MGQFGRCDRRWFRPTPHFSLVKVSCWFGHCGLAVISVYPFYRSLALGVGLGVVVGGGFVLPYRSFALGIGFGRSAFAVVSYFPSCLSFALGVGFDRSAPTLATGPTPRNGPERNHRERNRTKSETTANGTGPNETTAKHREPTNRPPPGGGGLLLGWAISFPLAVYWALSFPLVAPSLAVVSSGLTSSLLGLVLGSNSP